MVSYQSYFNYQADKEINDALDMHNKSINDYYRINQELALAVGYWKAMYFASKTSNYQLEEQLEIMNDYWKREYIKVNDELFDLKHTENKSSLTIDELIPKDK